MSDLVQRLSTGDHRVEISIRPERTIEAFRGCLGRNYIHVKFTQTRGGTELGISLDKEATDLKGANLDDQSGSVRLVGSLTLDYEKVRCIADIDLKTWEGVGHLEPVTVNT